jgi:tetratricopeptide (TPR) repeat protein
MNLADALMHKGLYDEAVSELQKLLSNERERFNAIQGLALTLAMAGKREECEKYLAQINKTDKKSNDIYYNLGVIYSLLGDKDKAFENLNKMEKGYPYFGVMLRNDPDVDSLRNDLRFEELLKKYTADFSAEARTK